MVSGLGVGITPSALVSHGIETTVVEIDPAVYEFAQKYFQLRENHPPVIEDAVKYAARTANETKEIYDYIIHDVFTGGVEPIDLFTFEFFENLYTLLKPDGVIAIVRIFCSTIYLHMSWLIWRIELCGRSSVADLQGHCPDYLAKFSNLPPISGTPH